MLRKNKWAIPHIIPGPCPRCTLFFKSIEFLDGWGVGRKPTVMIEKFEKIRGWVFKG